MIAVCARCRPRAAAVHRLDGRKIGWKPEALYVGYLVTKPFAGWKRPPAACPNCGAALEIREDRHG